MNTVDAYVVKVLGKPEYRYGIWWLLVSYDAWGSVSETELMFSSKKEAEQVKPGYKFVT